MQRKIKVLVVDDSALVRGLLTRILGEDPAIEVVGTASDPYVARERIKALAPDVITLDVEMPRMDGLTFLRNLMRLRPLPVVMVSSLTEAGAETTLAALELGAFDFVAKPKLDVERGLREYADDLVSKVKAAAAARVFPRSAPTAPRASAPARTRPAGAHLRTTDRIIAIGASTGGTEALAALLAELPADAPGVVIAQHMPERFTLPFAQRLDRGSAMHVQEAFEGAPILPGHAYVAPGNRHLVVRRSGARYACHLQDTPTVNRHRPSVDVLFDAVATHVGPNAIGVLLTGMGADGADGLGRMRAAGAKTIAQDEASSVVWGMPGEAVKRGAAMEVLPLTRIAARVLRE